MDTSKLREEASLEAARESLIAISYILPDTAPNSAKTLKIVDTEEKVSAAQFDKADFFRAELISISHPQSPTGPNGHA